MMRRIMVVSILIEHTINPCLLNNHDAIAPHFELGRLINELV